MQKIIPAIIPQSLTHLEESLLLVNDFAESVQIDIVDGKFVPFTSWPYIENESPDALRETADLYDVEVDLMVVEPETVIGAYVDLGVDRIVVHLESTSSLEEILTHHEQVGGYQLGLSILNDTPLEDLLPYVERVEYVQLMGIKDIGSQGQPFDVRVLDRIKALKSEYPQLEISIDGSVNAETLPQLREAGADRFVSGSALLGAENPKETFLLFEGIVGGEI